MNHSEIEACVIRAKEGSKQHLMKVLDQYKPFIFKTARKYNIKNHDISDLEQIGYMAVINAMKKYRTGSSTFSSYAFETIKNAFRETSRQNLRHENILSLNTVIDPLVKDSEYIECISSPENLEDTVMDSQEAKEVRNALSQLPPQEKELVEMVYFNGMSLRGYADKKGMTYYHANKKKDMVLGKLGRQLLQ